MEMNCAEMKCSGHHCTIISGDVRASKVEHRWTIENYSAYSFKPGNGIISPTFFVGGSGDLQGRLVLFPHGHSDKDRDYLSLYLYLDSRSSDRVRARVKCYLFNAHRQEVTSCRVVNTFLRDHGYGFPGFVRRSLVPDLLVNDTLTVFCSISVLGMDRNDSKMTAGNEMSFGTEINSSLTDAEERKRQKAADEKFIEAFIMKNKEEPLQGERKAKENKFIHNKMTSVQQEKKKIEQKVEVAEKPLGDYCNLKSNKLNESSGSLEHLLENEFSDVTLVCRGVEFRAHRNILAARSLVFSAMFMRKATQKENRFEIDNVNPDVFREVLRYIYTAKVENWKLGPDLLDAADKFGLSELKILCGTILRRRLNLNNVFDILMLADKHGMSDLKQLALNVIALYPGSVIYTTGFRTLQESKRTDLMAEAFLALALMHKV